MPATLMGSEVRVLTMGMMLKKSRMPVSVPMPANAPRARAAQKNVR